MNHGNEYDPHSSSVPGGAGEGLPRVSWAGRNRSFFWPNLSKPRFPIRRVLGSAPAELILVPIGPREGAVSRTVSGITKKYEGAAARMTKLKAEMKVLRNEWAKKVQAKAAARR